MGAKIIKHALILFFFIMALGIFSQPINTSNKPISIKAKNRTLQLVLKDISEQSGIAISYSNEQVPLDQKISINLKNVPLEKALTDILEPLNCRYIFVENQIVVKPIPEKKVETNVHKEKTSSVSTIKGYVKDKKTGETIVGATIYTSDTKYGTISNNYGFYSLTLPEGTYNLTFSFVGFKAQKYELTLRSNQTLNVSLTEDELTLEPVIINVAEDSNRFVKANRMGYTEMPSEKTARMPMFFAEPDVIKALQYMPGIKNTIDGSSNYYVRGGERDQNLILLDDAPVYNPSHLFGFFTCINPEAVSDIKLYKSDFPSYVGGKLSSVLEVKTKEGNNNKFSMSGETGLITGRLSAEGPLFKKKSSFYVSYRKSHIERLAKKASSQVSDFRFDDLNAKFNVSVNEKNRLLFSFYAGNDYFYLRKWNSDKHGINWGNRTATIRWNKIFGSRLFSNSTAYYSNYNYNFYTSLASLTRWNSQIVTAGIKDDFIFFKKPDVTHYFGMSFIAHSINPGIVKSNNYISPEYIPEIQTMRTGETHTYMSTNRDINDKFKIRYGLRASTFSNKGSAKWFSLSDDYHISDTINETGQGSYNRYFRLEPSLTLSYLVNKHQSVKFNYFRAHQYLQVLSNTISPFTTIEVWHPSTPNVKPQSSDQLSAAYYCNLFNGVYLFVIEGFYKHMRNQFDYNNQSNLLLNPYIEKELRFGTTNAYGTEISLKKEYGKLQGWIGYAYTRAIRKTKDVNNNNPYPAYSDRPYDLSVYLHYHASHKWLLTSGIIYAAGMPFTSPTGYYNYMGYKLPLYTAKNNARMPDYFRWDVSFQRTLNKPGNKWTHYLTFSIFNITNHKNPVFINFNKITDDNGKFVIPANYAIDNTLETSQITLIGFIPSIKYNFKF